MAKRAGGRVHGTDRLLTPAMTGRKRAAFTAIALLLPAVLFAAVELTLRLAGAGDPTSFFVPVAGAEGHTTNPQFGWRFFPPAMARTPLVAWVPAEKRPAAFRIFVLGESAAMGVPEPALGFSRMLEVMLAERYPDVQVEMINTAMTAINSHVIRDIARECARRQPDLLIIYMGNNEVVGPFGPATIFTRAAPVLPLVRARMVLERTRTGQVAARRLQRLARESTEFTQWRGMEMLTEQQIPAADARLATTYRHFRKNLEAVLDAAAGAGVPALVSTVAVNLRDSPPFGTQHGLDLTNAEVQFQLGEALTLEGRTREALDAFRRARDLDLLRFRADSRINDVIRTVAQDRTNRGVTLVDAERRFAESSGGAPGDDLFWEHVHLNTAGNYLLASTFFARVSQILDARRGATQRVLAPPPAARVAERLALTDWDRLRMASGIFEMMKRPPFTRQLGHAERLARKRRELAAVRAAARREGEEAERAYRRAIAYRPHDLHLRASFGTLLRERGRFAEASEEWRVLLAHVPGVVEWRSQLAFALADQAANMVPAAPGPQPPTLFAESEAILRAIVAEQPELPAARVNLANVLERQQKTDAAIQEYREALRLDRGHETARLNLAALSAARGDLDEAARLYREIIALDPQSPGAHARLGGVLERQLRRSEAIAEYRRALELDPDLASVRNTLGYALERQGELTMAIDEYRAAIAADPDYGLARVNLADLLMREGRPAEAARELREVHAREPDHPAALIGLALILSTADAPLRDPVEAVRLGERAVVLTDQAPETLRALALAYAAAGRLGDAVHAARRGAEIARARGDTRLAGQLDEQGRRYREAAGR